MNLSEALNELTKPERLRLEWDFDQGNPSFVIKGEWFVGVFLDKVDRLEVVESEGKWALAIRRKDA